MDAHGLLKAQGWRGLGHTLHATDDNTGLARPLLLSRKTDRLGLGHQNVHAREAAVDQWWLNAFDQHLKSLTPGTATEKSATTATTEKPAALHILAGNWGGNKYRGAYGLEASFVRGERIDGTMEEPTKASSSNSSSGGSGNSIATGTANTGATTPESEEAPSTRHNKNDKNDKKRKRTAVPDVDDDEEEIGRQRKREKKEMKKKKEKEKKRAAEKEESRPCPEKRSEWLHAEKTATDVTDKRREAREAKREKKAERKIQKKAEKKQRKAEVKKRIRETETKDERRIRRAERRAKKAAKRARKSGEAAS